MLRRTLCARRKLEKLMVANRGEIACRVFRTCRDLNIRTVALFCEAERHAKHVVEADEAVCIGVPPATSSYLRGDEIVSIARSRGVDAIHPGYGFLSENAPFAESVARAGIEFIGPPSSAIVSMGSKSESKRIMEAAGVPVVPGYYGDDQSVGRLRQEAGKIGYPVLIKAVSGGGGKGMKIVEDAEQFELLLESAKREAMNFFKDDRVILERYVTLPRHIECQVFCDKHGGGVFFFERDCSVQRRYQKVLEEAPAPHLSEEKRRSIGEVAVKAAKAVGYVGAGTVEFIFDTETGEFYFMEMNTRLQVEHPVTEEVCRVRGEPLDLVRLQIQTAMGLPLGFTQADVALHGWCIEARVYAESPERGFLPESGPLAYIREPAQGVHGGCRVRLDTGFREGDQVLIHYDPMISKLIVWGEDRERALRGLRQALDHYHIAGTNTNVEFLKRCCDTEAFRRGGVTTNFINEHSDALLRPQPPALATKALGAAAFALARGGDPWSALRLNGAYELSIPFQEDGAPSPVQVTLGGAPQALSVAAGGESCVLRVENLRRGERAGVVEFDAWFADGARCHATGIVTARDVTVMASGALHRLALAPLRDGFGDAAAQAGGSSGILSPMPGKVAKLLVKSGDAVVKGQPVLILEAMKMEHPLKAPRDGVITFSVPEGTVVGADQSLGSVAEKS